MVLAIRAQYLPPPGICCNILFSLESRSRISRQVGPRFIFTGRWGWALYNFKSAESEQFRTGMGNRWHAFRTWHASESTETRSFSPKKITSKSLCYLSFGCMHKTLITVTCEVNIWLFIAVLLLRNKDEEYNNPLANFVACYRRQTWENFAHLGSICAVQIARCSSGSQI